MKRYLRSLLPAWPVVPTRLWLTLAGAGLTGLSLCFKAELWPSTPRAAEWSGVVLAILVLVGWCQGLQVAWNMTRSYAGPWPIRFFLQLAVAGIFGVSAVLLPILLLIMLFATGAG